MEGSDKESYVTVGALLANLDSLSSPSVPPRPSRLRSGNTHRGKSTDKPRPGLRVIASLRTFLYGVKALAVPKERRSRRRRRGEKEKSRRKKRSGSPPSLSSSIRSVIDEFFDPRSRFSPDGEDENLNEPSSLFSRSTFFVREI